MFLQVAQLGEQEFEVPMPEGGLHAGEWETSMLLAIHPDLVHMDRAEAGYVGDPQEAIASLFDSGVDSLSETGAIGDPDAGQRRARAPLLGGGAGPGGGAGRGREPR